MSCRSVLQAHGAAWRLLNDSLAHIILHCFVSAQLFILCMACGNGYQSMLKCLPEVFIWGMKGHECARLPTGMTACAGRFPVEYGSASEWVPLLLVGAVRTVLPHDWCRMTCVAGLRVQSVVSSQPILGQSCQQDSQAQSCKARKHAGYSGGWRQARTAASQSVCKGHSRAMRFGSATNVPRNLMLVGSSCRLKGFGMCFARGLAVLHNMMDMHRTHLQYVHGSWNAAVMASRVQSLYNVVRCAGVRLGCSRCQARLAD